MSAAEYTSSVLNGSWRRTTLSEIDSFPVTVISPTRTRGPGVTRYAMRPSMRRLSVSRRARTAACG